MKKTFKHFKTLLTFCFSLFLSVGLVNGQNLLLNGDFELWDDSNTPTSWTKVESITQESGTVNGGTYSAKHTGGTSDLGQSIAVTAGETYTISLWYYIESGDGTDARIWSYWKSGGSTVNDNADELRGPNNSYFTSDPSWQNYTVTLEAPATVDELYLEVRTYSGATVYWDDFSVLEEAPSTDEPDWCNLQSPENGTINYGGTYAVYAQVWEDGLTADPGQGAGIEAWIGVSTENTDPSTWTTWIPAGYNVDVGNNDEYMAEIGSSLPAGTYYYASRFSLNNGPYVYGGYNESGGGFWDETTNVSGVLTVNPAVVSLPYERNFETGDLYTDGWTTQVVTGSLDWEYSDYSGDHFAEMSNYDGGNQASETWLITPGIDLSGVNHAAFTFMNTCNYTGADIEVKVSSDYDGISEPSTATWTDLSPTLSGGSWNDVSSGELDISDFAGETVYIAFKYTGTDSDGKTWQIDDLSVYQGSTEPSLTITSPEDGSTLYTQTVSVTFDVQNFQVGDNSSGTDDGYVVYTLDDGAETDLYSTDDFELTDLSLSEHTLEMWLVDNNGLSLDPAVTYSVTFTIDETVDATIYEIQYTTAEGDDGTYPSPAEGKAVNTSGIVTAVDEGTAYFIQDGAGAWNGIYVYDMNAVTQGDEVALTGEVVEYFGLTQLTNISAFEVVSNGNTLPEATTVSTADANTEDYESVLVKVENAECTDADTENNYGMWTVDDGSGALLIDDDLFAFVPTAGTNYNVTGVGFYSYSAAKILPRSADDIEEATSVGEITATAVKLYPNPANDVLFISSDAKLSKVEVFNLLGQNVMSKTINSKQSELNISDLDAGMYLIKVYGENGVQTQRFLKN